MKKVALLFPGSGVQYIGMGRKLYDKYQVVREVFEEASDAINFDLKKLCFEGNMDELTQLQNAQPAVLTVSYAAFKVYMEEIGIEPECLAGHSLGEYSALTCAEAIKFSDAVKLTRQRGKFIAEANRINNGSTTAVGKLNLSKIKELCKEVTDEDNHIGVACYNSLTQIVISGHTSAVGKFEERVIKAGGKYTRLNINFATHSVLLEHAKERLREEFKKYKFSAPRWQVISNITGKPYEGVESIAENLSNQLVKPVMWKPTMEYIRERDVAVAIELGPKTTLKKLASKNVEFIDGFSFDVKGDREELSRFLITKDVGYVAPFISRCLGEAISTKNNNPNKEEYEEKVIIPCNEMRKRQLQLEVAGKTLTTEEKKEMLDKLKIIFETKGVGIEEQRESFIDILKDTGTEREIDIKEIIK